MSTDIKIQFLVLRAVPDLWRGEALNYGLVFLSSPCRAFTDDTAVRRLRALGANFVTWNADDIRRAMEAEVDRADTIDAKREIVKMLTGDPSPTGGQVVVHEEHDGLGEQIEGHAKALFERLVRPIAQTLPSPRREATKKQTRLVAELRAWLRSAKAFSTKVEDLSRGRVVANYPIDPSSDLYSDFAVRNGRLHVIETLDLRGIDRLTPSLRGDAAIKGVTLDEARERTDGQRVVIVSASDYQVARPAIQLVSRYADDVWDMHSLGDRQKVADFFATALHRPELPQLALHS